MHIALGNDIINELRDFIDKYKDLSVSSIVPIQRHRKENKRLIYQGFHKALFDLLAFPGQKVESRILVDVYRRRLMFLDLGAELTVPTGQLALYFFIIQQSIFSSSHELPIEPTSPVRKKTLQKTFAHIYGLMSDNATNDYTKSLTPNLSHLKNQSNQ